MLLPSISGSRNLTFSGGQWARPSNGTWHVRPAEEDTLAADLLLAPGSRCVKLVADVLLQALRQMLQEEEDARGLMNPGASQGKSKKGRGVLREARKARSQNSLAAGKRTYKPLNISYVVAQGARMQNVSACSSPSVWREAARRPWALRRLQAWQTCCGIGAPRCPASPWHPTTAH